MVVGLPAGPGAASGQIVFSASEAERKARLGKKIILVREETSQTTFDGDAAGARTRMTARGGVSSHADAGCSPVGQRLRLRCQ